MRSPESLLLDGERVIQKTKESVLSHIGRALALLAVLIAGIFTFTEIAFVGITPEQFTLEAAVILICGLVMYFSLESEGECYARGQSAFTEQKNEADALAEQIGGEQIGALREYLLKTHRDEVDARKKRMLMMWGISEDELTRYLCGERFGRKKSRYLKRVAKSTPRALTPSELLFFCEDGGEEITTAPNPLSRFRTVYKLIPSILCTLLTVGIIIEVKDGFTPALVLEGLLKLSALFSMGLRGYLAGVNYVNGVLLPFHKVREKLLSAFIKENAKVEE